MIAVDNRPGCETGTALGVFLLNLLFFPILITTLAFLLGAGVTVLGGFIALAAAAAFTYCLSGRNTRQTVSVSLTGIAMAAACIVLCALCFDWSYDGNAYHKAIVGLLRDGWNPLEESFYSFAADYGFLKNESATWFDSYPKAAEIWGACVYSLTGNIESGKAFNLISLLSLFFLCMAFLGEGTGLKSWQRALCAGALVLNPVSVSQCLTFYVDSKENALKILEKVRLIKFAESLGGVETLITYPATQTHADVPEAVRLENGITETTLRLSVGIEDVEDLIGELETIFEEL